VKQQVVIVRSKSVDHKSDVISNEQRPRVDSAELSEYQNISKDELVKKLLHERDMKAKSQAQLEKHVAEARQNQLDATERHNNLTDDLNLCVEALEQQKATCARLDYEVRQLSRSGKEAQAQCDSARKERDNLKKHISAMNQAYRASGRSYDDIAEMKSLKDDVTSLQSRDEAWNKAYQSVLQQNDALKLELKETKRDSEEYRVKHAAEHSSLQAEFRDFLDELEVERRNERDDLRQQLQEVRQENRRLSHFKATILEANKKQQEDLVDYVDKSSKKHLSIILAGLEDHFQHVHRGLEVELSNREAVIDQAVGTVIGDQDENGPPRSTEQGDTRSTSQYTITGLAQIYETRVAMRT
jgi:chromosome segregation ATPase